jgi:hypothetical protein
MIQRLEFANVMNIKGRNLMFMILVRYSRTQDNYAVIEKDDLDKIKFKTTKF